VAKYLTYIEQLQKLLETLKTHEQENIETASTIMFDAIKNHHNIFVFGASHAGIISQELFYRAGGLALINPVIAQELELSNRPVTMTSQMERLDGYGTLLAQKTPFSDHDVLITHSVSGRNTVMIDFVLAAQKKNVKVIAITNLNYSKSVESRHSSHKRLFELADVTIDNHGELGDASIQFDGLAQKVGPTSTVIGSAIANSLVVRTVELCLNNNIEPPVFYSANINGGDEKNLETFKTYKNHIFYM